MNLRNVYAECLHIVIILLMLSISTQICVAALITYTNPKPCMWININSTDIPPDTQFVQITSCPDLQPQSGAFSHLYQLEELTIISGLTRFPDLTGVSNTLRTIKLYHNNISVIYPDDFVGLDNIVHLNLGSNPHLAYLPDVVQLRKLQGLWIHRCAFTKIPRLSNATNLEILSVGIMQSLESIDLAFYPKLRDLGMSANDFTTIPDFGLVNATLKYANMDKGAMSHASALHTVAMRTIKTLDLTDTVNLDILPTLCHENVASLVIKLRGSALKLCDCRNAWIKHAAEAGATIEADITTCDGGLDWHSISTAQLLTVCTTGNDDLNSHAYWSGKELDHPCAFPVHSVLYDVPLSTCVFTCTAVAGCMSVNYHEASGQCIVLAPSAHPLLPLSSATQHTTGWKYIAMK